MLRAFRALKHLDTWVARYDQLGCGLSSAAISDDSLDALVKDFFNVLSFLHQSLGEEEVHLLAHGFGGALLMEAMVRHSSPSYLPTLRSISLTLGG